MVFLSFGSKSAMSKSRASSRSCRNRERRPRLRVRPGESCRVWAIFRLFVPNETRRGQVHPASNTTEWGQVLHQRIFLNLNLLTLPLRKNR